NNYFSDRYQGIPVGGYTRLVEKMIDSENIDIKLNTDYLAHKEEYNSFSGKIIYTGPIDEYFNYQYGRLEYRSLRFE
ncbi:UDP-galactopyranose mutase, partial [Escherichia coli]|nr:UDP-galactopyranose mutase [Escherichia coli]